MEPASTGRFPQPCGYSLWHLWFSVWDGLRIRGWRYYFLDTAWFLLCFRGSGLGTASETVTSNYNVSHARNRSPLSREESFTLHKRRPSSWGPWSRLWRGEEVQEDVFVGWCWTTTCPWLFLNARKGRCKCPTSNREAPVWRDMCCKVVSLQLKLSFVFLALLLGGKGINLFLLGVSYQSTTWLCQQNMLPHQRKSEHHNNPVHWPRKGLAQKATTLSWSAIPCLQRADGHQTPENDLIPVRSVRMF